MADSQTYAYDELSNQVDDADGDLYDYNSEGNRLLAATVNDVSVTYSYDAAGFADTRDGLPIEWTASGQMAAYDGYEAEWDMLGRPLRITDTNSSPGVVRDWSRWGGRIEVDGDGFMVALDLGEVALGFDGARRYRHFDFRGNVSFISDDDGTIATLYAYSPYGVNAVLGDGSDTPSFAGRSELGPFMLLGARMYDPLVGRFELRKLGACAPRIPPLQAMLVVVASHGATLELPHEPNNSQRIRPLGHQISDENKLIAVFPARLLQ